jgi:hypothetical protein
MSKQFFMDNPFFRGEGKEKWRSLFFLSLSLRLKLRISDLSRRNLLLREFMSVAKTHPRKPALAAISVVFAVSQKYGGGIKRIFIYEMKASTEIVAGMKGN